MRIFATLFFSLFAVVTGVGIVVPLLPVYAHGLGASGIYIALIFAAFSLTRTVFLPCFGRLSDRLGRKPFIVTGLAAYAVVSAAFILFSQNVEHLICIRFIQGIASAMIMPAIQAYVGEIAQNGNEGLTMGRFNLSLFLGLGIGPVIGGVLNDRFDMNAAFGCMGLMALTGCLLSLWFLPPVKKETVIRKESGRAPWRNLLADGELAALFIVRLAYALCIGAIWTFLPVAADAEFHISTDRIGFLLTAGILVSGLAQTPLGYLADRIDRKPMIVCGGIIAALAICSIEWAADFRSLAAANILFGIGGGMMTSAIMAMAVDKGSRSNAMGAVMGLISMAHSTGMLCGALMAGIVMDMFHLRYAFSAAAALMLGGVAAFFFLMFRENGSGTTLRPSVAFLAGKNPSKG